MPGWHNKAGFKRLYILGAGFSVPASMPLTDRLLPLVFKRSVLAGQDQLLLNWLRFYCPGITFDRAAILDGKVPAGFKFEKFLTYMGVVSATQMGTSEQHDEHGSTDLSCFKGWTAEVIQTHQAACLREGLPAIYRKFAGALKDAMVFTFNWDTILETALDEAKLQYQLDRETSCQPPAIPILKLHGSIDWFTSDHCLKKEWMQLTPIGKSLPQLSRAKEPISELSRYYNASMRPWIVLPSFDKIYQVTRYDDLWRMPYVFLQNDLQVYIIGFSMRPDDFHTHAIIYPQLVDGARNKRIKLKVVDLATSPEQRSEVTKRFEQIPNCEFWFDGFNEECLDFISS